MNNEFITRHFLSAMNSGGKPESSKEVQQEVEVDADVTADHNFQPNIATSYVSRSFENVPCPAPHWRKSKVAQIFRRNSRRGTGSEQDEKPESSEPQQLTGGLRRKTVAVSSMSLFPNYQEPALETSGNKNTNGELRDSFLSENYESLDEQTILTGKLRRKNNQSVVELTEEATGECHAEDVVGT